MLLNRVKAVLWVLFFPLFVLLIALVALIELDWKTDLRELWATAKYLWHNKTRPNP